MAYHVTKRWEAFSQDVQELRWVLTAWLEALLSRQMTRYNGSDSMIYKPEDWSKYKLVPYDHESRPPLPNLDEGVLICLDAETCEALAANCPVETEFPRVPWGAEPLTYRVVLERTYRVIPMSSSVSWEERRRILYEIAAVIREMESL